MVSACRYMETTFYGDQRGIALSTSLNGFRTADSLVMDAKNDQTLMEEKRNRVVQHLYPFCLSFNALWLVDNGKFSKRSRALQYRHFL